MGEREGRAETVQYGRGKECVRERGGVWGGDTGRAFGGVADADVADILDGDGVAAELYAEIARIVTMTGDDACKPACQFIVRVW
jgi:hypothetical protein